jgi:hypothetical protein
MTKEPKESLSPAVGIGILVLIVFVAAYFLGSNTQNPSTNITGQSADTQTPVAPSVTEQKTTTPTPVVQNTAPQPVPAGIAVVFELSVNPSYLFSKDFNPNRVKVYGVGIGDLLAKIDQSSIIQQQEYAGWIHTTNGVGYQIANGIVVNISLNDLVKKMGLFTEDAIIIKFGKPDQLTEKGSSPYINRTYYYINKGLVVNYYETGGITVNIIGH